MTLAAGDLYVSGSILSYQQMNRIYTHFRGASAPSSPQGGGIHSDSDDNKLYHYGSAWEEILQLTRSADVSPQFATARLMDTGADHYLDLKCNENLTGHKLLNLVLGDAARTITLSGNPTLADWFDQAVKVASSPTHVKITLSDGQVSFPATAVPSADANTLDDYEEGTWTPDLQFGGAKVGVTYNVQSGEYIKIGNLVFISMYVNLSSKGSSNGDAILEGLPFTVKNSEGSYSSSGFYMQSISFADSPQMYFAKNTTLINFYEINNAGVQSTLTDANFDDASVIMLGLCYTTG